MAPEFEILTSVSVNEIHNLFSDALRTRRISTGRVKGRKTAVILDLNELYDVAQVRDYSRFRNTGLHDLLEYLDILFCQGTLSEQTKSSISTAVKRTITSSSTSVKRRTAAHVVVNLVLTSPDCAIAD